MWDHKESSGALLKHKHDLNLESPRQLRACISPCVLALYSALSVWVSPCGLSTLDFNVLSLERALSPL
jgi:hypothetical protein